MALDWPLVFQGLKTILDPLAIASWPIALVSVAWLFRTPIARVTDRISQFNALGTSAVFTPNAMQSDQQEAEKISGPAPFETSIELQLPDLPVPTDSVFDKFDEELRENLEEAIGADDAAKLRWAIRERSISEATRIHETNYRLIFGSQIFALKQLNIAFHISISTFEAHYNEQVRNNVKWEGLHNDRTFDQWAGFLISTTYVERVHFSESPSLQITAFGKQFLTWMVLVRVSEYKAG
jgi:hypothetical protein